MENILYETNSVRNEIEIYDPDKNKKYMIYPNTDLKYKNNKYHRGRLYYNNK